MKKIVTCSICGNGFYLHDSKEDAKEQKIKCSECLETDIKHSFIKIVRLTLKSKNESITSMLKATKMSQRTWFNLCNSDSAQVRTYQKICDYLGLDCFFEN